MAETVESKRYEKLTVNFRDPERIRNLRRVAKRRGLVGLSNAALIRLAVDAWCGQQKQ